MLKEVLCIIDEKAVDSISEGLEGNKKQLLKGCLYAGMEGVIEGMTIIGGAVSAAVMYYSVKGIFKKGS